MLFDSYYCEMDVMHEGDDGCCSSGLYHKTVQKKYRLKGPGVLKSHTGSLNVTKMKIFAAVVHQPLNSDVNVLILMLLLHSHGDALYGGCKSLDLRCGFYCFFGGVLYKCEKHIGFSSANCIEGHGPFTDR